MVVKSVRGRRRYIVYTVPEGTSRTDVLDVLSPDENRTNGVKVITCFDGRAVIRCEPGESTEITERMRSGFDGCDSLLTSGTLRTLRDRYPELKVKKKTRR